MSRTAVSRTGGSRAQVVCVYIIIIIIEGLSLLQSIHSIYNDIWLIYYYVMVYICMYL